MQDIAAAMHMSYDGCRKRFRRLAGTSPAGYQAQRVIERACQLKVEGTLSNQEIAGILGFCDEFHFAHRFRQPTCRTPGQIRASIPRHAPM